MTHRDEAVAALAGTQRTIVTHEQLITLGCGQRQVAHWANRGRLQVVFHGVYSVVRGELPLLAREHAALLACREHAFLSHHTAAYIWGLRKWRPADVEVSVVGRYRASSEGIRVHRIREIDRREIRHHEGLWVSTPERAILEIAATLPAQEVAAAIDDGLAGRVLDRRALADVLARHRGRRGAGRLAAVLAGGAGRVISRSKAERAFLKLIRDARLPMPKVNEPFRRWELDFFWPEHRLVVEVDGYGFHSGPRAFHRDHEKDLAVHGAGLGLLRFTRDHVIYQSAFVLAGVAAELARRGVGDQ